MAPVISFSLSTEQRTLLCKQMTRGYWRVLYCGPSEQRARESEFIFLPFMSSITFSSTVSAKETHCSCFRTLAFLFWGILLAITVLPILSLSSKDFFKHHFPQLASLCFVFVCKCLALDRHRAHASRQQGFYATRNVLMMVANGFSSSRPTVTLADSNNSASIQLKIRTHFQKAKGLFQHSIPKTARRKEQLLIAKVSGEHTFSTWISLRSFVNAKTQMVRVTCEWPSLQLVGPAMPSEEVFLRTPADASRNRPALSFVASLQLGNDHSPEVHTGFVCVCVYLCVCVCVSVCMCVCTPSMKRIRGERAFLRSRSRAPTPTEVRAWTARPDD